MIRKVLSIFIAGVSVVCVAAAIPLIGCGAPPQESAPEFVQFGGMQESIGTGQSHGRVGIAEVVGKPHFYGVGALETLRGEITILDSVAIVTGVGEDGSVQPIEDEAAQATMLAGQSVGGWAELGLAESVSPEHFDGMIAELAAEVGVDVSRPFVFVIEGTFTDLRLHVINGACPLHARMAKLEIEEEKRHYELETAKVSGTIVGIYAADSVGKLTHPATSVHAHLIYTDGETKKRVTGHLERVGVAEGAALKFAVDADGP